MDIIIERGCGLDVHKKRITACIMGTGLKKEIRTFGTMTNDLLQIKAWLKEKGITQYPECLICGSVPGYVKPSSLQIRLNQFTHASIIIHNHDSTTHPSTSCGK